MVERLGPHLETQPLHLLDNVVLAFIADRVEVAHRIVEFRVDDVEQRRDFRELRSQMVQQGRDAGPVVAVENHDHHYLAGRSRADDHVAHQPCMFAGVVERITVFDAETLGLHADGVRRLGLEPALVDIQHLVEHVGNVESHGRRVADVARGLDLLARQPAAAGEGEFEFVAVELRMRRAQAGRDFGQGDLADARKLIANLLGFEAQLLFVGQILPLATAADPEMFAERLGAQGRFLHIADDEALHEAAALGSNLHVDHVARDGQRHEDHHVVPAPHGLAFGGQRRYFEPLDQGIVRFLSCHSCHKFEFGLQRYKKAGRVQTQIKSDAVKFSAG